LTSYGSVATRGAQEPRVRSVPPYAFSHGHDALELAASAGLVLDPWQADVIVGSMGVRPDGKWSAFEVGVDVPRQNGKDAILEVRTLAGLYLIGERLITFSAHQFDTSLEAFRRLLELVEEADLQREIKRSPGRTARKGIELKTGQRVRYRTRTKGGGRGFSGDCLILNEAMILPESAMGSVFPTLSARPNPQVWYTGRRSTSCPRARRRVRAGPGARARRRPAAGWFEHSAPFEHPDEVSAEAAKDPGMWAMANPSSESGSRRSTSR
jgi:phage terminase large subunit-like protein